MTILLDTHALQWWSSESHRLSAAALEIIERSSELAVAGITWFELAWMAAHDRITVDRPIPRWLGELSSSVRTVGITPQIAAAAVALDHPFPGDPADRVIYTTAVQHGMALVTKDRRMRDFPDPDNPSVW